LVTFLVTQNLVLIVVCSLNDVKGRFASALDIIERAAPYPEVGAPVWGGSACAL
jgi:hypothetical protein